MPSVGIYGNLEQQLITGAKERWCVKRNCTTCGSPEMRGLLGEAMWPERGSPSRDRAEILMMELRGLSRKKFQNKLTPQQASWVEQAVMWLIYGIWRCFGDSSHRDLFPKLEQSWAGEIYKRMRDHYENVQNLQRLHWSRQGLKKMDWSE